MVMFGMYVSALWVLVPGVLYLVGRQLYSWEYLKDPKSRGPGMALTLLANAALIIGVLIALVLRLL
jgi:uncharacterized membrane protein YecN with MAPEG domain